MADARWARAESLRRPRRFSWMVVRNAPEVALQDGAVRQGHACCGMVEILAERQAAKAPAEDDNVRFLVLRHVTVFIQWENHAIL